MQQRSQEEPDGNSAAQQRHGRVHRRVERRSSGETAYEFKIPEGMLLTTWPLMGGPRGAWASTPASRPRKSVDIVKTWCAEWQSSAPACGYWQRKSEDTEIGGDRLQENLQAHAGFEMFGT